MNFEYLRGGEFPCLAQGVLVIRVKVGMASRSAIDHDKLAGGVRKILAETDGGHYCFPAELVQEGLDKSIAMASNWAVSGGWWGDPRLQPNPFWIDWDNASVSFEPPLKQE